MKISKFLVMLSLCSILLIVSGCSESDNPAEATIPDPDANFTWSGETVTPARIIFHNHSDNANSYYWDFGNGQSSIQENPTITFDSPGEYSITLEAENENTGKKDTRRKLINITPGRVFITRLQIEDIPFTTSSGAGWDLWSGPDLYFNFYDPNDNLALHSTMVIDLVDSDLPIGFTVTNPYECEYWNSSYIFRLYDDDDFSGDEFIGSVSFRISSIIASFGHAETAAIRSSNNSISIKLYLDWE